MRKLLFLFTLLALFSCSKDDPTCDIYFHDEKKTDIWRTSSNGTSTLVSEGTWGIRAGTTPYLFSHKCEQDGQIQSENFVWSCQGCANSTKNYYRTILVKH